FLVGSRSFGAQAISCFRKLRVLKAVAQFVIQMYVSCKISDLFVLASASNHPFVARHVCTRRPARMLSALHSQLRRLTWKRQGHTMQSKSSMMMLPARVEREIALAHDRSETVIGCFQMGVVIFFALFYLLSPSPVDMTLDPAVTSTLGP
ncbi:MAG: hypothetical protein LH481_09525, partial [Burkholderiales bacterium]|nr:hypothetical protein [Burkholderiales bacterium]